ncbi:MAG: tRNA (guanosine(37)-N1)-methyltransferase TrmD [Planctomycetaceae bacterium]|jgi:tRNA (guanine37-N1)-methyltransferase|nr:tRNA (guanosine(37)-N1)-methyltransferase TrmD [Planctomycetaceae bacterium]
MLFDILTLFPNIFDGYLSESLVKNAIDRELIRVRRYNIRDWSTDKHHKVDDSPYGGGSGMVLKVDCVVPCVEEVRANEENRGRLLMMTPQGKRIDQKFVEELSQEQRILLLCGRYEGFDERVSQILQPEEISIGDYVLNGGEAAAMIIIDAVIRLVPGVLGDEFSSLCDSFSTGNRLLEGPQYTRPRVYRGLEVPEILVGGNHEQIQQWRAEEAVKRTEQRRPDLFQY